MRQHRPAVFPRLFYAHRGAPAELPENTVPSFRRALERGATALETDAHLTRDGHVVLSHDATGRRMANRGDEIRRCTLAEVQQWDVGYGFVDARGGRPHAGAGFRIPTLEEVLLAFPDVPFNVDAKQEHPEMVAALLAVVRRLRATDRVRIASFAAETLRAVRARGYEGGTGLARTEVARLVLAPEVLLSRWPVRGNAAQIPLHVGPIRLDTRMMIDRCHAHGVRVDYWTVNDPAEARRLLRLGADGIMTDDPAAIAPVFRDG